MANPFTVSKNKLHWIAVIILVLIFAAYCPGQTNPPESEPVTEIPCAEISPTCRSLCEAARSGESRAVVLENSAREARAKAYAAVITAQVLEKEAAQKRLEARLSGNNNSPWIVKPIAKPVWQGASFILQLFVPKEARNRYRDEAKATGNAVSKQSKNKDDQLEKKAAELMREWEMAVKSAEGAKAVATNAGTEALHARSSADNLQRSYEECLCREESK